MLRAIREIQPRWVVGENVRGLTNWNGGMVFDEVQADLENEGYEVTPYLLPACSVNAPHRRDRIWFVAYRSDAGVEGLRRELENGVHGYRSTSNTNQSPARTPGASGSIEKNGRENNAKPELRGEQAEQHTGRGEFLWDAANAKETRSATLRVGGEQAHAVNGIACRNGITTHACNARQQRSEQHGTSDAGNGRQQPSRSTSKLHKIGDWEQFPTQSPICSRNDGFSAKLDGITFSKWREKSIGAYGNAIVPQVALQIFKAIQQYEQ